MPRRKTREQRHQNRFSVNNTHRGAGVQQQNGVAAEVLSRRQLGERVMRGRSKLQVLMLAVAAAAFAFAFAVAVAFRRRRRVLRAFFERLLVVVAKVAEAGVNAE